MTKPPIVSVIFPTYNVEKYLADCLNSVLNQTFQNFEAIVVDDCSTDNSRSVAESYVEEFGGRLKILSMDKNSGGAALPRNKGLHFSRGEYVFFMDPDDMLTPTGLEEMYTLAKSYDADVVYCQRHYETNDAGTASYLKVRPGEELVEQPQFDTDNLVERIHWRILEDRIQPEPWTKLVRRDLLTENEISFPHVRPWDDTMWTCILLLYAKKWLRVSNAVYIQRMSENSIMRSKKTTQQKIESCLSPIIIGLKSLDKDLKRIEFFQQNPDYHYAILERFVRGHFNLIFNESLQISPSEFYSAIQQILIKNFGKQDVLIAMLCTFINSQQRNYAIRQQEFNQFAVQAQNRIKELEEQ